MEAFGLLIHGFAVLLTWKTLALMMLGLVLGIFVGVLPGLGGPNGVAILLPLISSFALKFGPPEFFAVYLLTFCSFVGLGREAKHKTVISMSLGLLLAGIGMDTVSGQLRMTFGSAELLRGINFLVAVIGLFGISEILLTMEERLALR